MSWGRCLGLVLSLGLVVLVSLLSVDVLVLVLITVRCLGVDLLVLVLKVLIHLESWGRCLASLLKVDVLVLVLSADVLIWSSFLCCGSISWSWF